MVVVVGGGGGGVEVRGGQGGQGVLGIDLMDLPVKEDRTFGA